MYTNHEPLVYLYDFIHLNSRQIRWLQCLSKLQFHIVYQPGQYNTAVNALSHISYSVCLGDSTSTVPHSLQYLDDPVVAA